MSTPVTSGELWTATATICTTVCANSADPTGRAFAWVWIVFAAAFWLAEKAQRKMGAQG